MNKRGGEKVMYIYWVIIFVLITIGIVSGIISVFGSGLDVRMAEAGLLKERVVGCLVEKGELTGKFGILKSQNLNSLLDNCGIDLSGRMAVKIEKYDENFNLIEGKDFGDASFFPFTCYECFPNWFYEKGEKYKGTKRVIYVLENNSPGYLKIVTSVGK
jgi:hypothetical protein